MYQPRSQGLSSLPPLVVGTETLVAAGHVTTYPFKTAGWVGTQENLVERTIKYHPVAPPFQQIFLLPRFWVVTWPAATKVSVPTTKKGREERPWKRDWKCTFSAPRNSHVINYAILSSYRNTIINQSARVFSLSYFLKKIIKNWIIG